MNADALRATFDSVVSQYQSIRPSYPAELIEDILKFSGIRPGQRILEIGCGTGQATRLFASRGYSLLCLDIGQNMIEAAKEGLRGYGDVEFICCAFEDCKLDTTFPLIVSATAFHWIDPRCRYFLAYDALADSGTLAVFSNHHVKRVGFFEEVQEVYKRVAPQLAITSIRASKEDTASRLLGEDLFVKSTSHVYPWEASYSATEYIRLLGSYSDHISLPSSTRAVLFEKIVHLIEERYDGLVRKSYEARLRMGKRDSGSDR